MIETDFTCDWEADGYPEKCDYQCDWCKKWNNTEEENHIVDTNEKEL